MKIQRVKTIKNKNYTAMHNGIARDQRASLKAKGLLFTVMSLSDEWDFTVRGICTILKESKSAVYTTIKELKELGYCKIEVLRDSQRIVGWEYTFFEEANSLLTDFQEVENKDVENVPQVSIKKEVSIKSNKVVQAPPPPESTKPKPENPRFDNGKPQYQSNRSLSTSSALDSAPAREIIEATHEILKFQLPIPTQERIAEVVPAPLVREWCEMIKDRMCGREDDAENYLKRSIGYWLTDFKKSYRIQLAELESTPPPIPKAVLTLCDKCRHTSSMIRVDENVWTKCKHQ